MATEHYYTEALWGATVNTGAFDELSEDIEVDVAVIGGGITGISTAYNLSKAGKKVAVLEAFQVGKGTTGSSTGNLYATTSEHLYKIGVKHDNGTMKTVASSRGNAIKFIEDRVREFDIQCEFVRAPWYLFSTDEGGSSKKNVEKELEAAQESGLPVTGTAPEGFPFKVSSILNLQDQAQFNPFRYIQQLASAIAGDNCHIYENTKVLDIKDGSPCVVKTSKGTVKAKKVVQATHTPKGVYAVHTAMEVYREYAFAVRINGELPAKGTYWHLGKSQLYSSRPYQNENGNYLIVLDASQKLGKIQQTEESFKHVEEYMRSHFDVDKIEYSWAAQNYQPADSIPYIGKSPAEKNIYIATGFGPDGLVYGTLSSIIISDLILDIENNWARIYDPSRFTPVASAPGVIKENAFVAANLVKDYFSSGNKEELEKMKSGEGKVVKIEGKKVAVYKDEEGEVHVTSAICPHMGCVIHWNNGEKSWDCPCHGSRFSVDGEVLEGPAFKKIEKSKLANIANRI